MLVLLTGAFGNIGQETLALLLESGHDVRCFDVETDKNRKIQDAFTRNPANASRVQTAWGDIRNPADVDDVVEGVDAIIHLAAIIPPLCEKEPTLSRAVNVEGTRLLIQAAKKNDTAPRFIFSSSVSIYGPRMKDPPPRTAGEPVNPTDNYTRHKAECEKMLKESGLPWTILRIGVVLVKDMLGAFDPILFEIPLDQRMEVVHTDDTARACVNCVTADVAGKILPIGGGESCQMLQRDFVRGLMEAAGIGMFAAPVFRIPKNDLDWYYTDYLDTEESQRLLAYQVHTFRDYLEEVREILGARRVFAQALAPLIRFILSVQSPHYRMHMRARLMLNK